MLLAQGPLADTQRSVNGQGDTSAWVFSVRGVPVALKTFLTVADIGACDLLFVPAPEAAKLADVLVGVRGKNVLIVGESTGFAADGAGVNFYVEEKKLRFEINPDAAADAGLKVSSQLLKLARVVKPAKAPKKPVPSDSRPTPPASQPAPADAVGKKSGGGR